MVHKGSRTLWVIPIVHSQGDMGSLGGRLPHALAHARTADEHWQAVARQVRALALDWPHVKIYQDGLPDTEPKVLQKILDEVQSPNYALLRSLVALGAELVGTESPVLIREEYQLLRAVLTEQDAAARVEAQRAYAERAAGLLAQRDGYIAARIAATLPLGCTGLLFVGAAHQTVRHLPLDITVRQLPKPPATLSNR